MTDSDVGEGEKLENGLILKDGKITKAESDYMMTYIMSDNYIYTLKNENIVTQIRESGGADGWLTTISNVFRGILNIEVTTKRFFANIGNMVLGPLADLTGITDLTVDTFGKGMLAFYYEPTDVMGRPAVGVRGKPYNSGSMWNWDSIKVDSEKKTIKIVRNINKPVEFSVDGWVGRYGMPLEFLLSVHLSTLKPDLAYEMVKAFPTNVNIYLHKVSGEANVVYNTPTGSLSYDDIANISNDVVAARDKGIDVGYGGEHCGCTFTDANGVSVVFDEEEQNYKYEDGSVCEGPVNVTPCQECLAKLAAIQTEMTNTVVDNMLVDAYQPYIASVTDHWFRDVYYVLDESTPDMIANGVRDVIARIMSYIPSEEIKQQIQDILDSTPADDEIIGKVKQFLEGTNLDDRIIGFITEILDSTTLDETAERTRVDDRNIRFVKYDYDYEALYKERWTKYETENGEFVLYKLNPDGTYGERFNGTQEEANKQNIKVAKKALTIGRDDLVDDLEWNYNTYVVADPIDGTLASSGYHKVWSAYEANSQSTSTNVDIDDSEDDTEEVDDSEEDDEGDTTEDTGGTEEVDEGEDTADEEESGEDIKDNIEVSVNQYGNIVQKGEAQRTETNSKIKNMFLQRVYFTYDGGPEKAEAINDLRKQIADKKGTAKWYGAIPSDCMDLSTTVNGKTYTVADCSSGVSRTISSTNSEDGKTTTQELLNVSSMLENIHTADADYISRDFKELIVELGYYTKEELTDETPKMLEWLVPDTGSNGYPKRGIDKNENEYGTMIHSKGDIRARNVKMLKEILENYNEVEQQDENKEAKFQNKIDANKLMALNTNGISKIRGQKNSILANESDFNSENNIDINNEVGASDGSKSPEEVSVEEFLKAADTIHKGMEDNGFSYSQGNSDQVNYESSLHGSRTVDCSAYVSWVLQEVGILSKDEKLWTGSGAGTSEQGTLYGKFADYVYTKEEAGALQPGDILISNSHTQINGEEDGGSFIQYNAGKTDAIRSRPYAYDADFYTHVIRFALNHKKEGKPYTGYNGNEAVVSPVTGILLEYGTYSDEKMNLGNGVTEEYRVNVDYKYNSNGTGEGGEQVATNTSTNIPVDKVGYAKILVLDNKTYSLFEKQFNGELSSLNGGKSFVNSNGTLDEIDDLDKEKIKDWSDKEKTLYGYKEFAELYEKGGIAGNIVYIDGFVCEYPDEDYPTGEEDAEGNDEYKNGNFIPSGENIDKDHFKKIKHGDISSDNEDIKSSYVKDNEYKLASKKATEKFNTEATIKDEASPSLYTGGSVSLKLNENSDEVTYDGIFIKEGTVIGRTMTDKELLESDKFRNGQYGTYEELRGDSDAEETVTEENVSEDDEYHIIGNYLRIIMQDANRDIVEDVEDYIKLDVGDDSNNLRILDDFDVTDETNFPTLEQFKKMFEDCPYIYEDENAKAFIKMQEDYGINAAFAAVVTIIESSGGTNGELVGGGGGWPYNWFSISGSGFTSSNGRNWRAYNSFAEAVDDFGDLMANGGHYVDKGNHMVSQIGPIYCEGDRWANSVNEELKRRYEKVVGN